MLRNILISFLFIQCGIVFASGTYSGGGGSSQAPQSFSRPTTNTAPSPSQHNNQQYSQPNNYTPDTPNISTKPGLRKIQTASDPHYELGKYIYTGKSKKIGKFNYCIDTGTNKSLIKETRVGQFKGQSFSEIANKLYDCDSPNIKVSSYMQDKHLSLVIYYLNKRYNMGLKP